MEAWTEQPVAPSPDQPPRWPWGFGFAAFLVALLVTILFAGIAAAISGVEPGEEQPASFTIIATGIQDTALVLSAVFFAALIARPRAWHFGLRRTAFWPAVGWAALGLVAFYVFAAIYGAIVQPDAKQRITESLGADQGTLGLIVAGCVVMILAPLAEEVFFRGFFYGCLRNKFGIAAAAIVDGVVFGLVHFGFDGLDQLLILPPLMALGVIFCLVYEKTGSLWPVVGDARLQQRRRLRRPGGRRMAGVGGGGAADDRRRDGGSAAAAARPAGVACR